MIEKLTLKLNTKLKESKISKSIDVDSIKANIIERDIVIKSLENEAQTFEEVKLEKLKTRLLLGKANDIKIRKKLATAGTIINTELLNKPYLNT